MTYLFFGNSEDRLDLYLKSFLKKIYSDNEEKEITYFDALTTPIDDIYFEVSQLSLSFNKKVYVIKNSHFFKKKQPRTKENKILKENKYEEITEFVKYDEDEETIIIFMVASDENSLDKKFPLFEAIKNENKKFLEDLTEEKWPVYINKYFSNKNYSITSDAIAELNKRVNGNLRLFIKESEKLMLYVEGNLITLDDVKAIVTKAQEDDIFKLTKALISGNKAKAIEIYRELRVTTSVEPVTLISIMANNLVFLDSLYHLKSKKMSNQDIADKLNVKPGKIYYALQDASNLNRKSIKKALEDLYELDKSIKHNELDRFYAFELFLLNF